MWQEVSLLLEVRGEWQAHFWAGTNGLPTPGPQSGTCPGLAMAQKIGLPLLFSGAYLRRQWYSQPKWKINVPLWYDILKRNKKIIIWHDPCELILRSFLLRPGWSNTRTNTRRARYCEVRLHVYVGCVREEVGGPGRLSLVSLGSKAWSSACSPPACVRHFLRGGSHASPWGRPKEVGRRAPRPPRSPWPCCSISPPPSLPLSGFHSHSSVVLRFHHVPDPQTRAVSTVDVGPPFMWFIIELREDRRYLNNCLNNFCCNYNLIPVQRLQIIADFLFCLKIFFLILRPYRQLRKYRNILWKTNLI